MTWAGTARTCLVALLGACATPHVAPPERAESAALALAIELKMPIGFSSVATDRVYFVRLEAPGAQAEAVLESSAVIDGVAYLVNVAPGEYAAVAASGPTPQRGPVDRFEACFSAELIEATRVRVRAGELALIGRLVVDTAPGVDRGDAAQRFYAARIPEVVREGPIGNVIEDKSRYRGTARELRRDDATLAELRRSAAAALGRDGWAHIVGAAPP